MDWRLMMMDIDGVVMKVLKIGGGRVVYGGGMVVECVDEFVMVVEWWRKWWLGVVME
jgi:hypothetical protein